MPLMMQLQIWPFSKGAKYGSQICQPHQAVSYIWHRKGSGPLCVLVSYALPCSALVPGKVISADSLAKWAVYYYVSITGHKCTTNLKAADTTYLGLLSKKPAKKPFIIQNKSCWESCMLQRQCDWSLSLNIFIVVVLRCESLSGAM